jgi:hypothetical protein
VAFFLPQFRRSLVGLLMQSRTSFSLKLTDFAALTLTKGCAGEPTWAKLWQE